MISLAFGYWVSILLSKLIGGLTKSMMGVEIWQYFVEQDGCVRRSIVRSTILKYSQIAYGGMSKSDADLLTGAAEIRWAFISNQNLTMKIITNLVMSDKINFLEPF
ncbi:MAG: hypothetical protein Hyperionvirus2_95 [Hyperionvirus sp.]|uniref:Uncharacterized protein n=1 Tax=Hyperionvirus sp. TaxID=2487770 RepID=A0A3G5A669_9VIRU|nr:MAG: hypothetical protein Hyperionvirus2_95 [Hyperionvirus sp.]